MNPSDPILIPLDRLSDDALTGLIDEFVTREGTDYGHGEHSLDDKRRSVRRQLERGDVLVVFDPDSETANLVPKRDVPPDLLGRTASKP